MSESSNKTKAESVTEILKGTREVLSAVIPKSNPKKSKVEIITDTLQRIEGVITPVIAIGGLIAALIPKKR